MFLAYKEMRHSPARYVLITTVIALITYLVFFLASLAYGLAIANRTLLDQLDSDAMIISTFANQNITGSQLSEDDVNDIEKVADKSKVDLAKMSIALTVIHPESDEDSKINTALVGYESGSFIEPVIIDGRAPENTSEVVVSEGLRKDHGFQLGDRIILDRREEALTITAFTTPTTYATAPVIYTSLMRANQQYLATGNEPDSPYPLSAIVVKSLVPQDANNVPFAPIDIESSGNKDIEYSPIPDIIWNIPGYKEQVGTFGLMIGFLVFICAIIIGIFMFIITMQKQISFGIMKAQGINSAFIAHSVLVQTMIVAGAGLSAGLGFTLLSGALLPPSLPFLINWWFYGGAAASIVIVALMGALFSVRQVMIIDPLEAIAG
ncbi:MAG: ABC transporter permease [Actinomycetaceae bacterium]|nr:ABC transporter permease [Actinomycetaceae bacterium]